MCCTWLAENTRGKKVPFWHHRATLSGCILTAKAYIDNRKKPVKHWFSSTCRDNMVNFSLLTAEICWQVWGTPANFNGFRVLAALLHGTLVVDVSQTLRHWTEGAIYIQQGSHDVGHWLKFLVNKFFSDALVAKIQPDKLCDGAQMANFFASLRPHCVADADIIFLSSFFLSSLH